MSPQRGGVMPETAISVSLILCLFLGIIKVTMAGYQQSQADAAAFIAAHAAAQKIPQSLQSSYGISKAESVFPHLTTGNISVATSAPSSGPNNNGYIVASTSLGVGGLFANQAFGASVFSLHAHIVEPVVAATYVPASTIVVIGIPPACTTHNVATPTCGQLNLATPNPSNASDPFYGYACRAMYYAVLSSQTTFSDGTTAPTSTNLMKAGDPSYLIDASALSLLTDENGKSLGYGNNHSWPSNYQSQSSDSVNSTKTRGAGQFLTTQYEPDGVTPDPANADGYSTVGGQLGWTLQPLFNFGTHNGYDKC